MAGAISDPLAGAEPSAALRAKAGPIVMARHGEPALSRRIKLDSPGYRDWWARYEEGGLRDGQTPPAELLELARHADVIFASTRRRAVETADAVVQGRHFVRDPIFVEAPLPPPPLPRFLKFSPRTWGVIARFAWWWGYHDGQETRPEAQARAARAADILVAAAEQGQSVLVLAHGFFNHMMGRELQRRGWRLKQDRGYRYWATRRFERA